MNIEEMLDKWDELHDKYEESYQEYRTLELKMWSALYDNEEPFELTYPDGQSTNITIQTPDDISGIPSGCVIAINGAEWFSADCYWLSCYDTKNDDHEMFVRIMRNRDRAHLIHKSY